MACVTAKTATLVFAVFNMVLSAVASAVSVVGLIGFAVVCFSTTLGPHTAYPDQVIRVRVMDGAALTGLAFCSFVAVIFAVLLLHGTVKKNPEHIKAYFVYGVIVEIISMVSIMMYSFAFSEDLFESNEVISLTICVSYALILAIRTTYRQMQQESDQFGHKILIEQTI